jgi:hypothetical protein
MGKAKGPVTLGDASLGGSLGEGGDAFATAGGIPAMRMSFALQR